MGAESLVRSRIQEELARIERQYDVRVLFAVESGSRAWGFASPDSDYDVRFVYAHPRDWYLSVFEQRDVIEEMLPGDLDVSGWDLRKTLRLFSKCNLALNEWTASPIVYHQATDFKARLAALIPAYFNPVTAMHHYRRMAEHAFVENIREGKIRIKKLFYILRPLLACRWIVRKGTQPPTEFATLVEQPWVMDDERHWIKDLLRTKADAMEAHSIAIPDEQVESLRRELVTYQAADAAVSQPAKERNFGELDRLLRESVLS